MTVIIGIPEFAAGMGIAVGTVGSVLSTTVVPRGTRSHIAKVTGWILDTAFAMIANRVGDWRRRDAIRAYQGPILVMAVLVVWLLLLLAGFALMLLPIVGDLGTAIRLAGSSMFTLGIASSDGAAPTGLVFAAAATGLVVIALQIGYLPALYAAFNRRETLVTVLTGVAGAPAWGPEIVSRYAITANTPLLGRLYERWSDWAADISESHQAYPVLIYFRSPSPDRSWVVSLLAVLDAASLQLALAPVSAPGEARHLLNAGILALRDLSAHLKHEPSPPIDERILQLPREDFDLAVERMSRTGFVPERTGDEAWTHFSGWRINYELEAYELARMIDAVPAVWSGTRVHAGREIMPATSERVQPPADEASRLEVEEIRRTGDLRRQADRKS